MMSKALPRQTEACAPRLTTPLIGLQPGVEHLAWADRRLDVAVAEDPALGHVEARALIVNEGGECLTLLGIALKLC